MNMRLPIFPLIVLSAVLLLLSAQNAHAEDRPMTFFGYPCKPDCGQHRAGYNAAQRQGVTTYEQCTGKSTALLEGCFAWVDQQREKAEIERKLKERVDKDENGAR